MKNLKLVLILLLCSYFNDTISEPIDAQVLLTSPKHGMVKLSPTGEFITAYYKNEGKQSLDLFDRKTKKLLSSIDIDHLLKLESYVWLNQTQIYLTIRELGKSKPAIGNLNTRNLS